MNNVIHIKDWLTRHADVPECELALQLSDDVLQPAISGCDDVLQAAEALFAIIESRK